MKNKPFALLISCLKFFCSIILRTMIYRIKRVLEEREVFFVFSILFIVLNISAITMIYGFTDDYFHLYSYSTNNYLELEENLLSYGRPVNALLYKLFFSRITFISDFRFLRIISLVGMLVVILIVFDILKRKNLSKFEVFILLLFLFTLPAINLSISWASLFSFPLAMLFSIFSAQLVNKTLNIYIASPLKFLCWGSSVILLLISSFIHQTASMYYWVIVGIFLFFSNFKRDSTSLLIRNFLRFLIIWSATMGLSYLWIIFYKTRFTGQEIERINLSSNFYHKLIWFIYEVVVRSLNFHVLSDSRILPIIFLIVMIFGLYLFFKERKINILIGFLVVSLLIILSYFPNLVVKENWASYRTQLALSSMFILFLFIASKSIFSKFILRKSWCYFKLILLFLSSIPLFLYSYHQTNTIAYPQSLEIGFIKYKLQEFNKENHVEINIIQPTFYDLLVNQLYGYDEFGIPSSIQPWAPEPMVRLIFREMNFDDQNIQISVLPPGTNIYFDNSIFVINLRMIREFKLEQ